MIASSQGVCLTPQIHSSSIPLCVSAKRSCCRQPSCATFPTPPAVICCNNFFLRRWNGLFGLVCEGGEVSAFVGNEAACCWVELPACLHSAVSAMLLGASAKHADQRDPQRSLDGGACHWRFTLQPVLADVKEAASPVTPVVRSGNMLRYQIRNVRYGAHASISQRLATLFEPHDFQTKLAL